MKYCPKCETDKEFSEFYISKRAADGYDAWCTVCHKDYRLKNKNRRADLAAAYAKKHRIKISIYQKARYAQNTEHILLINSKWKSDNASHRKAVDKVWRVSNRARCAANVAKYRASKKHRTPPWLTEEDLSVIRAYYRVAAKLTEVTGEPYHVDHIIPLQGELVSGLHVPSNLQVIRGIDNLAKGNRIDLGEYNE